MRRTLCAFVLAGALLGIPGCGSGGGLDPAAIALQLQGCTGTGLVEFYAMLLRFQTVLDLIEGRNTAYPGYTVILFAPSPPPAPAFTRRFEVQIDLNADSASDILLEGTAVFSDDPADGLDPGATADVTVDVTGPGAATGTGTLAITIVSATQMTVSGTYTDTRSGCTATFTIDNAAPVTAFLPAGPALGGPIVGFGLSGTLQALVRAGGNTLAALVDLLAGSGLVNFSNVRINDLPSPDATIDGLPSTPQILAAANCVNNLVNGFLEVGFAFEDIVAAIEAGQTTIPGGSFSFNPLNGSFSATYDNDTGGTNTITGTAIFSPIPTSSSYTGTVTVTYNLTVSDGSYSASSLAGAPFVASFVDGAFVSFYGGATVTDADLCTGTLRVPSTNPLKQPQDTVGIVDVTADLDGLLVTMRILLLEGQASLETVTIGGVSVPPELFFGVVGAPLPG